MNKNDKKSPSPTLPARSENSLVSPESKAAPLVPLRYVLYPELEKGSGHLMMASGHVELQLPGGMVAEVPFSLAKSKG